MLDLWVPELYFEFSLPKASAQWTNIQLRQEVRQQSSKINVKSTTDSGSKTQKLLSVMSLVCHYSPSPDESQLLKTQIIKSHKAYIIKFSSTTRCTLALLQQNHKVTALYEHKITEECSRFYSNIPSVHVFKKPSTFSTHLLFTPIFMQVSKHFQFIKCGENPILYNLRLIFSLKNVQQTEDTLFLSKLLC